MIVEEADLRGPQAEVEEGQLRLEVAEERFRAVEAVGPVVQVRSEALVQQQAPALLRVRLR